MITSCLEDGIKNKAVDNLCGSKIRSDRRTESDKDRRRR